MTAAPPNLRNVLERAVPRVDAWRQAATGPAGDDASYKEWMHFCICLPGEPAGHLLVNLNITERSSPAGSARTPRLIVLGFLDGWSGALATFDDRQVSGQPGGLNLELGGNSLRWRDGAFHLSLAAGDIHANLRIQPVVMPTAASSVSFGRGHGIHWVVIPRLEASGRLRIANRGLRLDRTMAYHDHNWGNFRWGGDLAWEWGFVNPQDAACPYSVVFVRVSDRGRHRTVSQSVLLWRGDTLVRTFQDREIHMTLEGAHPGPRPFTLPRIASLLLPGSSSGVPSRVIVEAEGAGDRVRIEFKTTAKARVGIPSDVDPFRLVLLNETCGDAHVEGATSAGYFAFRGPSIMEFVRG